METPITNVSILLDDNKMSVTGCRRSRRIEESKLNVYEAADAGLWEWVNTLVKRKEKSAGKYRPLWDAANVGHLGVVRYLVMQGARKETYGGPHGETPLGVASRNGHLPVVQFLVKHRANMEGVGFHEWTPLISAIRGGQVEVARYLLQQGANRDKACRDRKTPLHYAAESNYDGCYEIAKLLMVYGADLNARDCYGRLPIDVARTEEMQQAIRDEPERRRDQQPRKRCNEEDRHSNAAVSASTQQDEGIDEEAQSNKKPRLDEEEEVADEDQDSEPSSDDED